MRTTRPPPSSHPAPLQRGPPPPAAKARRSGGGSAPSPLPGAPGERTSAAAGERRQLFNDIAPVYDDLNDRLSLGLHRVWKRMAVKWARPPRGGAALDVCCGSGDVARLLAAAVGPGGAVVGLDFAPDMLAAAAAAVKPTGGAAAPIQWLVGDATALPFDDASFDAVTVAYGLRNVADPGAALAEAHRVLVPGGRAVVLDFNNSASPIVDGAQALALSTLVVPAARAAGLGPEYEYLRPSIKAWWTGGEQEAAARGAGFAAATHHEIGLGLMGCLVAVKGGRAPVVRGEG